MYLLLFISSFLWGSNIVLMRVLLDYLPRYTLITLRLWISCLILACILFYRKSYHIDFKDFIKLFFISFFNVTLNFIFTFMGMETMNGTNLALMNALSPAILMALSYILFKETLSKYHLLSLVLTIFGFFVSIGFQIHQLSLGHLYLFLGLVSYNVSSLMMKKYIDMDSVKAMFYILLMGALSMVLMVFIYERVSIDLFFKVPLFLWVLFILVSGLGFGLIQYCLMEGNKKVGVVPTSFILGLNPCFTYLLSLFIFKDEISFLSIIGLLFMMMGLYVSIRFENKVNR